MILDSWLVIVTNLAYFNLKWSYNITSIHNKVWSESMQSAAIDSSTTIINPDPGLDLVRRTDGQTDTACYMLHVTGRHGHVMSSEVPSRRRVFITKYYSSVMCGARVQLRRLLRITREPAAYSSLYSFRNDQNPDLWRLETNSFIVRTRRSMIVIVRSVMCAR